MSCNNAHLLGLADAVVVSNYPLLSGVSPASGMLISYFTNIKMYSCMLFSVVGTVWWKQLYVRYSVLAQVLNMRVSM